MKKLGKLSINPEKVIKNEELVNLKGGYGFGTCAAICEMSDGGHKCNISRADAEKYASDCNEISPGSGHWCCDSCGSSTWYSQVC